MPTDPADRAPANTAASSRDPAHRAIASYLIALVVLGIPVLWLMAVSDKETAEVIVLLLMLVPTASALIAWAFSKQRIIFGRPTMKTLALALIPALLVGGVYAVALLGPLTRGTDTPGPPDIVVGILGATLLALGEEIGWRGYLLPQLRRRSGYLKANTIITVIWFLYHVPVIFMPGLYSNPDIPMAASLLIFATAIFGFSFFIGWIWEVHHDVWAPAFGHGGWNYLVQSAWPAIFLTGNVWLMGEFGLLPMFTMIALGAITILYAHRRFKEPLADFLYEPKGSADQSEAPDATSGA